MEKVIMAIVGLNFLKRSYFFPICDDWKSQIPSFCDMIFWNLGQSPRQKLEFNSTSKEIRATKHQSSGFAPNACSFSGAVLCSDASAGSTPFALHPKKGGTEAPVKLEGKLIRVSCKRKTGVLLEKFTPFRGCFL